MKENKVNKTSPAGEGAGAGAPGKKTLWTSAKEKMAKQNKGLLVLIAIFALAIVFSPVSHKGQIIFLTSGNITDLLRSMTPTAIMGFAMTLVIITGGIDLSVGSTVALSGVLVAMLLEWWKPDMAAPAQMLVAIALALLAGAMFGMLQGAIIAFFDIQPFIVTLAGMIGIRGFTRWINNNERIGLGLGDDVAGTFGNVLAGKEFMLCAFLAVAVIFGIVLHKSIFGRYVRAVGDNAKAAHYAGLPIKGVLVLTYTLMGAMAAFAGVLLAARTTCGDPNNGISMELDVVSVAAIGGTSLAGGVGTIPGTIIGALIIGILTNILGLNNVDFNLQKIIMAVIIIVAVASQRKGDKGQFMKLLPRVGKRK